MRMTGKSFHTTVQVAVMLLLAAIGSSVTQAAQSPARQQGKPARPEEADENDLIDADRPGIADGSSVIGARRVQVETGVQEEVHRREHLFFVPALIRLGISDRLEFRVEGNTFTQTSDTDPTGVTRHVSGLAPFSLGLKYHIADSGAGHPSLGVIVRVFPAWGTSDFHTHHVTGDLRLAADWAFAPQLKLSLNPNVGVGIYEDSHGKTFATGLFALTLNYLPRKRLNPFIDVGIEAPEERNGRVAVIIDTGVAYIVGHNVQLDASVGTGAHGQTPPHPFASLGVSFRRRK